MTVKPEFVIVIAAQTPKVRTINPRVKAFAVISERKSSQARASV